MLVPKVPQNEGNMRNFSRDLGRVVMPSFKTACSAAPYNGPRINLSSHLIS